jgi:hypothetical protein
VIGWVWFALGGREYYLTPLAVRGYLPTHRLLRPSGPVGQTLGVVGTAMMLMPFLYMARKRIRGLKEVGSLRTWLELHLFCGIVGPLLVTFHTSFKFNGIISAAYWSMVIVVLSGFVGRYLYVRIPRSIRGNEMTRAELDARAEALRESLAETHLSDQMLAQVHQFEQWAVPSATGASLGGLFFGDIAVRTRLRVLDRRLAAAGLDTQLRANVVALTAERATLLRRFAYLQKTKKLFELWHVFHLPLVYLLLVIASAHIAIALYMGYVPFRW